MSVQRSPPGTNSKRTPAKEMAPLMYGSDSALNTACETHADSFLNITKRQKRSFNEFSDNSDQYITEIKNMITELKMQQEDKFESLRSSLNALVTQDQEFRKSVAFMSKQYDDMLSKINGLEKENSEYKKQVKILEGRLEILERNSRNSIIEVRNVPKQPNENKQTMINIVKSVGTILCPETPIIDLEVKEIYRSKSDSLVVDFINTNRKEFVLAAYKQYNKSRRANKEPQLNTEHLNLPGAMKPIFISEVLTSKAGRLYFFARQLVKNKKIAYTWTSFGKVYVKKEEGQAPIRIEDEAELHKISL